MGFIIKGIKSVVKAVGGVIKGVVGIVSKVVGGVFGFLIGGKKGKQAETPNTFNKQLDPDASRKIVFGKIAAPLDTRYWEVWGSKGEKFDEVVAHATHRVNAILELYVEEKLAIDSANVVQPAFNGVLSRQSKLGQTSQTGIIVGGGTQWNANATFDGCAYSVYKWVPDDKKLPNGIPDRYTQVVEGALVYDPRRDSTVPGGSGTHRANDRSTWSYATLDGNGKPIGRNNALQALWYLLGWTIPTKDAEGVVTGEMLVAGRGVAVEDINMASFIAGANACEAAGYYTDLALSTADDHTSNENAITCDGLIGRLIDPGGLWSYYANVDDTANIAVELTDADILDGVSVNWDEYKGMSEQYNQVGGKFVNPSSTVLFQPFPYPLVRDATYEANLGKKVRKTQDFRQVLDGILAQRLARLLLNEGQYQGEFSAGFNYRALKAQAYSVVRYTSERFGWAKLFRVWRFDISTEGGVGMLLKEIHPSIWQAGTVAAAQPTAAGLKYDPRTEYPVEGFVAAQQSRTAPDGTKYDDIRLSWMTAPNNVRRTEIRYKLNGTAYWTSGGSFERDVDTTVLTGLLSGAFYDIQARHISVNEIPGPWANAGPFQAGNTGNVNLAAITAAGGTAIWANVTGTGRPQNNADVTANNQAASIVNQGTLATISEILSQHIALRAITASRLNIGETANVFPDPDIQDANSWIANSGTFSINLTTGVRLSRGRLTANNGSEIRSVDFPVESGRFYFFSGLTRVQAGGTGTTVSLYLEFYALNGVTQVGDRILMGSTTTTTLASRIVAMLVPANAHRARFVYKAEGGTSGGFLYDPIVRRGADVESIATNAVRLGVNITRNDGIISLTDAIAVTSLGQAATIANQAPAATDSTIEGSADVTKTANGPTISQLNYSSFGALTSTLPKSIPGYFLTPAGGSAYNSGVTWNVSIVSGSFVGTAPTVSTSSGQGTLVINSGMTGNDVTVAMTPTFNGKTYAPVLTKITRNIAVVDTGGTAANGGTSAVRSISKQLTSTSFVTLNSNEMTVTVGSNGTVILNCGAELISNDTVERTVEFKAQRETSSGVWVDVGTVVSASVPVATAGDTGFISGERSATGLTASSSQKFRWLGRLTTSGNVDVSGTISAQG